MPTSKDMCIQKLQNFQNAPDGNLANIPNYRVNFFKDGHIVISDTHYCKSEKDTNKLAITGLNFYIWQVLYVNVLIIVEYFCKMCGCMWFLSVIIFCALSFMANFKVTPLKILVTVFISFYECFLL